MLIFEDILLAISTKKIYQLEKENSIIKILQNEVERMDIEWELALERNKKRREKDGYLSTFDKPLSMKYKCNITKTAKLLTMTGKTLREWKKDGIIDDTNENFWNEIDLMLFLTTLKTVKARMNILKNATQKSSKALTNR